jgi:hypothetical protein
MALFVLWLSATGALPGHVLAQDPWQLISQTASFEFSTSLDFDVEVRAAEAVTEAVLFYGIEGENLVRRIYPPFRQATVARIEYSEPLEPGQYAPGTTLVYWWRLTDASGGSYDTPAGVINYTDDAHDWESTAGDRIVLYHYALRRSALEDLLSAAEDSLARIRSEMGVVPEQTISIYVYRNESDMSAALATRSDDYDARVTTLGVAVDEDTLIVLGSQPDIENTMAHELSHIVVGLATENPYARLPRWLDEGLAMVAEGNLPEQNAAALRRAVAADDLLSVRSMTSYSGRADEVDLYYGEAHSVVSYLIDTYGRAQMAALLDAFSLGSTQSDALIRTYGLDLDSLDAAWRQSLGLEPRTESLLLVPGRAPAHPAIV